jgi:small subunit ribosomal protein S2
MAVVTMKALLESGVHFGHRTHKWHPAMKPYIFTERNSIHIIDLQKTVKALDEAYNLVRDTVAEGGTVLFVGTKRQAQETIQLDATRASMPYVTNRWLGGMLTNWRTIRQRVNELDRLERMRDRGDFSRLPKKEVLLLTRQMDRLDMLLGGIRHMNGLPDLLFVVDVRREDTAIHEANLLEIPVIALVDTNCNPGNVDYVIPSNDDAIRAIKLLVGMIADACLEGLSMRKEEEAVPRERVTALAEEPELSDEELLGEATLAKIPSRGPEAEEEEDVEAEAEEQEEHVEEEEVEAETEEQVEEEEVEVETEEQEEGEEVEAETEEQEEQAEEEEVEAEEQEEGETEEDYEDYEGEEEGEEEDEVEDEDEDEYSEYEEEEYEREDDREHDEYEDEYDEYEDDD